MDNEKKELLVASGVDLTGALERFMNNEMLYENYLRKFTTNTNYTDLEASIVQENWENALAISHNLKGTSGSLGFTKLHEFLTEQVALFRQEDNTSAAALMDEIMPEYRRLLEVAKSVIN